MVELDSGSAAGLKLTTRHWELMRADVIAKLPQEACGLVAGREDTALVIFPITNELHSSVRFRMDPVEQLRAFQWIDDQDLELTGIYHSHPNGPEGPSLTDIAEAYYPDVVYLIWSPGPRGWRCKGFRIRKGTITEIEVQLDENE